MSHADHSHTRSLPFDKDAKLPIRSAISFAIVIAAVAFVLGYLVASRVSIAGAGGEPADVNFTPVWKAWHVIDEKFVPAAVSTTTPVATTTEKINQTRVWGMIQGLAESLNDPYTFFLPPTQNTEFT